MNFDFVPLRGITEMNSGLTPIEKVSFLYIDPNAELARNDTMEDYARKARERQIEFHRREIDEGPSRKPAMPEVQVDIHRRQLEIHLTALTTEHTAQIIPFPVPELPEDLIA